MLDLINKYSYQLGIVRYVILLVLYIMVMVHWMHPHIRNLDWAEAIIVYFIGFEVGILTGNYVVDGLWWVYKAYH